VRTLVTRRKPVKPELKWTASERTRGNHRQVQPQLLRVRHILSWEVYRTLILMFKTDSSNVPIMTQTIYVITWFWTLKSIRHCSFTQNLRSYAKLTRAVQQCL
jgi:hypothetical protein